MNKAGAIALEEKISDHVQVCRNKRTGLKKEKESMQWGRQSDVDKAKALTPIIVTSISWKVGKGTGGQLQEKNKNRNALWKLLSIT